MAEPPRWPPRRLLETAFVAAAGAAILYCLWGFWHDRQLPGRLERVHIGMDRQSARAVMGRPSWEGECGRRIATLPREGCVRELGYASAFAPVFPTYYLVQLDRRDRVIEAERIDLQ